MTTIFERTQSALAALSPIPVSLAPYITISNAPLPDTFVVYQLINSPPEQHADNAEAARSYLVQVTTYSRSGLVSLPDVDSAMLSTGFEKVAARQLPKTEEHHGLACDYIYLEA